MKNWIAVALLTVAVSVSPRVFAQPDCGDINECVQKAVEAAFQAKEALAVAVPRGAVMAFNRIECPDGWSDFAPGAGRTVFGLSGAGAFASVGATGGAEFVTLTVGNIPPHTHPSGKTFNIVIQGRGGHPMLQPFSVNHHPGEYTDHETKPNNNPTPAAVPTLPPYVVLKLCERR
ncbi:hypothetical protein [Granulosicoccus antarcticus]|uniref:Phage tail collar domain-containing protein n=1 Tax=Granulosicoccus antarcticus IMCC3135 TaxID=1192854 RepID=A0A2Z2P0U1_9GAMM|nr:hypothetical protein [Granulosicoccus antarcticus]ASJ73867.1 hypothetical protein IMCC3135_18940 [Granulosicoccus antarcticus IMCC3135]